MSKDTPGVRYAEIESETDVARIRVVLDLDGARKATVDTGIGYLDRLLGLFAYYGGFDLGVSVEADLDAGDHNVASELGGCIGRAIRQALGDTEDLAKVASEAVPQGDALVLCAVDISAAPRLSYDVGFTHERIAGLSTEAVEVLLRSLAVEGGMTVGVRRLCGEVNHDLCEGVFKSLGRALSKAASKAD